MLEKSRNIVGEEEEGGGRDEDSAAVGERNTATAGVSGATLFVPNNWLYGRLDTESSGGMTPASHQAFIPSFDRCRIGNAIAVYGIGSPGCIEELNHWFEEDQHGWERRVLDLEEKLRRLR